jgi:hypothetical protein
LPDHALFGAIEQGFAIVTWYGVFTRTLKHYPVPARKVINHAVELLQDFVMSALRAPVNEPFLLVSG